MANFWKIVNNVIEESDVILLVLDARMPDETRNIEIEKKIQFKEKKMIYVINKCDLLEKSVIERYRRQYKPSVFVSSVKHYGSTILREKIMQLLRGEMGVVGVLGYPNVGKSSVINMLRGKGSAPVSSISGFTKGVQKVRISQKVMLLDTPGVIPFKEDNKEKQTLTGTVNFDKLPDPELAVLILIEKYPGKLEEYYGAEIGTDAEDSLEKITIAKKKLMKGGIPDVQTMSRRILKDWQQGKLAVEFQFK